MMDSDLPPGSFNSTGHLSTVGYRFNTGGMHHSTSTPAGVDGGGGLSRTPPATPKKGGKMLAVRVQMLDDTVSMFQVQSKALGKVLFEQVCRQLHLLEADYFGLEYQEHSGTKYWLDLEKPLCRQIGLSLLEPMLRFCVKFYTPDPARLEEEFTRYLFCLQVKRDLAAGHIQCNENTAALIASYIVQAECGDFVPEDYPDHTYLSGYKFCPQQDSDLERRIMENHKKHIGQSPAEADLNLLETARRCELYGMKMHPAKDSENVPLNLAVAHSGIVVFQHYTKINTFSWAKIRKISFKRKKFLIKLHQEGYGFHKDVVEFFFEGRNECKNFWKKCVENHGFFRCSSVKRLPRHKTRVISRGSSFRYSGKTQKQIVEFVRDNYVKRQTFQRSGSFRASRSLRSSRANVSGNINTSISAHPLLPLPPGSDAISLEWEQQPHYLEASLMMRGYTEAEARAAASRAAQATRRSSEGATRPTLQATTCAAMRDKVPQELVTRVEVNHHRSEDSPHPHRTAVPLEEEEEVWKQATPETTWSRSNSRPTIAVATIARDPTPPHHAQVDTHPDGSQSIEAETPSSGSYVISPDSSQSKPLEAQDKPNRARRASEAATSCNGLDQIDSTNSDSNSNYKRCTNGNIVDVHVVSESNHSIDVLSGGESDAGDTLRRSTLNNNSNFYTGSISSYGLGTLRGRHLAPDNLYYVTKELLLTERTYKSDLEVITVWWSGLVSELVRAGGVRSEGVEALGRPCVALEQVALAQAACVARLERACRPKHRDNTEEDLEYHQVAELFYDYLKNSYDAYWCYVSRAGAMLARLESVRRGGGAAAAQVCAEIETRAPLSLAHHLLRVLHRLLQYRQTAQQLEEVYDHTDMTQQISTLATRLADAAESQLSHAENHALLCQLQRDITGFDKLLVPEREFVRLGCLYKHSSKGLQQRMLFLFSDVAVWCSKPGGVHAQQFRVHSVTPLCRLTVQSSEDIPNAFVLTDDSSTVTVSCGGSTERDDWVSELERCCAAARLRPAPEQHTPASGAPPTPALPATASHTGLAHVCWHRGTTLTRIQYHLAMKTHLSGYLLRKFKNSHGWQKLWVVLATATLLFYKGWHEQRPLASLPLLGYHVSTPSAADDIHKEFVFKLLFKNHVYFFRAESEYTFNRWIEELQTAIGQPSQS